MTNSPTFDQQLALNDYWKQYRWSHVPARNQPCIDRFVRASFYNRNYPKTDDIRTPWRGVFSVIRNCSFPYWDKHPRRANISTTRWRKTVADHKNKLYFFESTLYPNVFRIDFTSVDFSEGAPVMKLDLVGGRTMRATP